MIDFPQTPKTAYVNANIITIDENQPNAEAMIVENGIIQAIGTTADIQSQISNETNTIDLKGAVVMPGFIDPHTHPALTAYLASMIDLSGFKHDSNAEVWAYLSEIVKKTPPNQWIICKGIDPILVSDLQNPTLAFLDSIAPNNPIVLFAQSLHSYWGNSLTFEKVGINTETPNPNKHSYYEKDSLGNLTGLIVEQQAIEPILQAINKDVFHAKVITKAVEDAMKDYALKGNTTVVSAGLTINDANALLLFEHLSKQNPSLFTQALTVANILPKRSQMPRHFVYIRHDRTELMPETNSDEDDFYDILGVKHWYDGSPYIGSMYLNQPYLPSPLAQILRIPNGHQGKALVKHQQLKEFIKTNHDKGWQIAIHAQGDAALNEVLDAYKVIQQSQDLTNKRHRLEHCLLLSEQNIKDMKVLNMTPSFHINHLYYYGDALQQSLIGQDRTQKILPIGSAKREKVTFSLHADQPMFDSHPFRLIQTAIERTSKNGQNIGKGQEITLMDAIKALTIDAAWQIQKEDKIGSLTKGKYADFIILDSNPFETPTDELENIKVLKTYINGNLVQ